MAARAQPTARVDRDAAAEPDGSAPDEVWAIARRRQVDLLADAELRRCRRVMDLDAIQILGPQARLFERLPGGDGGTLRPTLGLIRAGHQHRGSDANA